MLATFPNPAGNIKGWIYANVIGLRMLAQRITNSGRFSRGARSIELVIEKTEMIPFQKVLDGIMLDMAGIGLSCSSESLAASQLVDYRIIAESSGNIFDLGVDP